MDNGNYKSLPYSLVELIQKKPAVALLMILGIANPQTEEEEQQLFGMVEDYMQSMDSYEAPYGNEELN